MPKSKEFAVRIQDKPGALGECCDVIAKHGVNILAVQGCNHEKQGLIHMFVDDPDKAKKAFDSAGVEFTEQEVALVRLDNDPGMLGRAAATLGGAKVNVEYVYCGMDPGSNKALVVFGVDDTAKASGLLDELAEELSSEAYTKIRGLHKIAG